jgi:glycogen debranching enzyme
MTTHGASADRPHHDRGLVSLRARPHRHIVSHGETALVVDAAGEIHPDEDLGLFVRGTRVLSTHAWRAGGRRLVPVSLAAARQDQWHGYYLVPASGDEDGDPRANAAKQGIEVLVVRVVGEGMHEDVRITNHAGHAVSFVLELRAGADFVGQDEAGNVSPGRGRSTCVMADTADRVDRRWRYRARRTDPRDRKVRRVDMVVRLQVDRPAEAAKSPDQARRIRFRVALPPRGQWHGCLVWSVERDGGVLDAPPCPGRASPSLNERLQPTWLETSLSVGDTRSACRAAYVDAVGLLGRAQRDLHALRMPRLDDADAWTVGAGVPAYLATFGRDILTTGWQSAMLGDELMRGGLNAMAKTQGRRRDDWRDESPGRMLHEARLEPAACLNERPTARYYGSLTSSSLFPFVVGQLWQWTGDPARVQPFVDAAISALRWLDDEAMQVPGPFYAVRTRSSQGLDNQTWKDSSESVVDMQGNVVEQPVATCEEQAIAYIAKRDFADVLEAVGRRDDAVTLRRQAEALKRRFNEHFWVEEIGFLAMALDARGRPIASVGSNALRCLASGIVEPGTARHIVERAFAPDMFSGWGIRTLSSDHPAYNPHGYHVGTIWPVEHGPFALGLRRYGFVEACQQLCLAQFQLADLCEGQRLPECVTGHARDAMHPFPAIYAAANAPQAWSASTPVVLLQALLGIRADAPHHTLWLDPALPEWLPELRLQRLRIGQASVDIDFTRDDTGATRFDVTRGDERLRVRRGMPDAP